MNNLANSFIQSMQPYTPPLDGRAAYAGLLLDFNERTVPVSPYVEQVLHEAVTQQVFRRYPEYNGELEARIVDYLGEASLTTSNIMVTNGGDQAIDVAFRTFTTAGDTVIIPSPSFAMFYQAAGMTGNTILEVPYNDDLSFPAQRILESVTDSVALITICSPNNPTGTLAQRADIVKIIEAAPQAIILIDEAYAEFSGVSSADLIQQYANVMILRSFSKPFGLGGLRVGYLIACEQLITEMLKVRGPYDVNILAYKAACAALQDWPETKQYIDEVMLKAKPMLEQFFTEQGITWYPSEANYILFKPQDPKQVAQVMDDAGFRMRPRSGLLVDGMIRVSIGTVKQMKEFITAYQKCVIGKEMPTVVPARGGSASGRKQAYAFLDRDGALIFEPPTDFQIDSIEKMKILDGVTEGLQALQTVGYKFIMVTNQNGVGTAAFPYPDFDAPHQVMLDTFRENGIEFERVFICPHMPEDNCLCRKPQTGLVEYWLTTVDMDSERSFMYGDRETDRQFAENLGIQFIKTETNAPMIINNLPL